MRGFHVLRVAMCSYTVESKRIASRKFFKWVPDLQDVKKNTKRAESVAKPQNHIFLYFSHYFSNGSAAMGH